MSGRGVDFLHRWVDENLAGFHQAVAGDELVTALATRCCAEAAAQGLARSDLEDDIGRLETIIREAIENNPADEVTPHMRYGIN